MGHARLSLSSCQAGMLAGIRGFCFFQKKPEHPGFYVLLPHLKILAINPLFTFFLKHCSAKIKHPPICCLFATWASGQEFTNIKSGVNQEKQEGEMV